MVREQPGPIWNRSPQSPLCENTLWRRSSEDEPCPGLCHSDLKFFYSTNLLHTLDPPSRESLIEDLERILEKTRTTTIFATHDRLEALRLSDRIAVMNQGKIVQIGSPGEVMNHPVDEFVASFVGVETILTGKVLKKNGGTFVASVSGQEIEAVGEAQLGEEVILCIRLEKCNPLTSVF